MFLSNFTNTHQLRLALFFVNLFLLSITFTNLFIERPPILQQQIYKQKFPKVLDYPTDSTLCTGTLGENIFTDGDFGSGNENNVLENPNLAAEYTYQPHPPPNDGFYTITNNTSNWGSFAATNWIDIKDHSDDPNGYMMVVNASQQPGRFYEKIIEGLCENTLYEFSADIINMVEPNIQSDVFPDVVFLLNDQVKFSTGKIPQDAKWRTYGFSFVTPSGTAALKLTIRNNSRGGNGNDLALDNITFRACGPEVRVDITGTICEDDSVLINSTVIGDLYDTPNYRWQLSADNGASWQDIPNSNRPSQFVTNPRDRNMYRFIMANSSRNLDNPKCRVISTVGRLRVVQKFNESRDTICAGLTYAIGHSVYDASGVYVDSLISPEGCDSIVTTYLTVLEDSNIQAATEARNPFCPNEFNGAIDITNITGGYGKLSFTLDSLLKSDVPRFENLGAGSYQIKITDAIGCEFISEITLEDPPELNLMLPENIKIELGDSILLEGVVNQAVLNAKWLPGELVNCDTCLSTYVKPLASSSLKLQVSNSGNCSASASTNIIVEKRRDVYIPNAFSPNNDGINDFFFVYPSKSVAQIKSLNIFDRWGAMVFEAQSPIDISKGWDGTFRNKTLNPGVYIYFLEVEYIDGEVLLLSGDVAIFK
ncbi:MAG TPA: gliding motility-associated C-terminal domain-containing protein [Saprospiraceae bacterium]|nr:gliding motility-associated C-terminal domain-containing protein [Saprospiraceae bacterium]